jgi:UDP-N-acetyl-D-glucosamine dehydrogenase
MPFYPGPGLGGHCIPIDPFYLTWKAHEFDCPTRFIEIAGEINTSMPFYVVQEMMNALNERGKALKNSKILMLGMAYKRDVGDYRESPSLKLFEILSEKAAAVDYHDPFIPVLGRTRDHPHLAGLTSIELTPDAIRSYDVVLIATDHSSVDYAGVVRNAALVVDTRNATRDVAEGRDKIVKA